MSCDTNDIVVLGRNGVVSFVLLALGACGLFLFCCCFVGPSFLLAIDLIIKLPFKRYLSKSTCKSTDDLGGFMHDPLSNIHICLEIGAYHITIYPIIHTPFYPQI